MSSSEVIGSSTSYDASGFEFGKSRRTVLRPGSPIPICSSGRRSMSRSRSRSPFVTPRRISLVPPRNVKPGRCMTPARISSDNWSLLSSRCSSRMTEDSAKAQMVP